MNRASRLPSLQPNPRTLLLFLSILAPPLVARLSLIFLTARTVGSMDAWGILSDLSVSVVLFPIVYGLIRYNRVLAGIPLLIWGGIHGAFVEHVVALDSLPKLAYVGYLLDPTFFRGSALAWSYPLVWVVLVVVPLCCLLFRPGTLNHRSLYAWGLIGVALFMIHGVFAPGIGVTDWRVNNVFQANLYMVGQNVQSYLQPAAVGRSDDRILREDAHALGRELFSRDRSDSSWLPPRSRRARNVLLIVLEGASGAYLPSLARHHGVSSSIEMKRLDRMARRGTVFRNFINLQRQTNRGVYALWCGRHPKLQTRTPKMTQYLSLDGERCLPHVLAEQGFRTVGMKASGLEFMSFGSFMRQAGFEQIMGRDWFDYRYAQNRWGVDDRAFFEQAFENVETLNQSERPWFLSMITVGTHDPYILPDTAADREDQRRVRAFHRLDRSLGTFIDRLRQKGLLEDTLVLITGDESQGVRGGGSSLTGLLSQNLGFLVALGPGMKEQTIDRVTTQMDLPLSILDYLDQSSDSAPFRGRSLFREYETPRPVLFANTFRSRVMLLDGEVLTVCTETLDRCLSLRVDPIRPLSPRGRSILPGAPGSRELSGLIQRANRLKGAKKGWNRMEQDLATGEDWIRSRKGRVLFGGQYWERPEPSTFHVDLSFRVEAHPPGRNLMIHHALSADNGHTILVWPFIPVLGDGDRIRLRYDLSTAKPRGRIEAKLFGQLLSAREARIEYEKARLVVEPSNGTDSGYNLRQLSIQRSSDTTYHESMIDHPRFQTAPCLHPEQGQWFVAGGECSRTILLQGPNLPFERGSKVRVIFRMKGTQGSGLLQSVYRSRSGTTIHRSEPTPVKSGQTRTLVHEHTLGNNRPSLAHRLLLEKGSDRFRFRIQSARFLVLAPKANGSSP